MQGLHRVRCPALNKGPVAKATPETHGVLVLRRNHVHCPAMRDTVFDPSVTWHETHISAGGQTMHVRGVDFGDVVAASTLGDASPWWAHVWPAGIALAEHILSGPRLDGTTCLDLGTGTGVVGIAAGLMGARVTFADLRPQALALADENAKRAELQGYDLLEMDWNAPPPRKFDRIYASDVLYEREHFNALVIALRALLAPGASAYVADPKRQPIRRLFGASLDAGMKIDTEFDRPELLLARISFA